MWTRAHNLNSYLVLQGFLRKTAVPCVRVAGGNCLQLSARSFGFSSRSLKSILPLLFPALQYHYNSSLTQVSGQFPL